MFRRCGIWVHCCSGYLSFSLHGRSFDTCSMGPGIRSYGFTRHRGRAGNKLSRMYKTVDQSLGHFPRVRAQPPSRLPSLTRVVRRRHFLGWPPISRRLLCKFVGSTSWCFSTASYLTPATSGISSDWMSYSPTQSSVVRGPRPIRRGSTIPTHDYFPSWRRQRDI